MGRDIPNDEQTNDSINAICIFSSSEIRDGLP